MQAPREKVAPGSIPGSRRPRRAAWAGLAAAVVAVAAYYAWEEVSARRQAATVLRSIEAGRLDEAEAGVGRLRRSRPRSAEAAYLAARLAWARKRPDDVLRLLLEARDLGYPDPPMDRLVGLVYAGSGRPEKAEDHLVSSWKGHPGPDPEVADALCRIYFESFRFAPALAVIDRWTRQNPDDLRPLLWRAEVHSRTDPGPEARLRDHDAILARDPGHLLSRLGRADALRQIGRLDDAMADYRVYLKASPDDVEGLVGAAKAAEGLDEEDEALDFYERILDVQPGNTGGQIGKAAILLKRKDPRAALELLDKAIAADPHDPEPHYRRGQALERLGRRDEAEAAFAERRRLQKEQEQIEKIRKGLVRDPGNGQLMAEAAAWLLGHGYDEQGLEWAKKTLAARPDHAPTLKLLADHYQKAGNAALANFYRSQLPRETRTP